MSLRVPIPAHQTTDYETYCVNQQTCFRGLSLLRQVRIEAGLRQEDLAKALGMPQSVVSKFESGERRLDLLELRDVCQALGISLVDFVRRFERQVRRRAAGEYQNSRPKSKTADG